LGNRSGQGFLQSSFHPNHAPKVSAPFSPGSASSTQASASLSFCTTTTHPIPSSSSVSVRGLLPSYPRILLDCLRKLAFIRFKPQTACAGPGAAIGQTRPASRGRGRGLWESGFPPIQVRSVS